jgi:hypothetical protein
MDLPTIGFRLANELRAPAIAAAGLRQAHYPAPSSLSETPAALVFSNPFTITALGGEAIWEGEMQVQLRVAAQGRLAAEINALEPLIMPIIDHFAPGTDAYHLRVGGQSGQVHKCEPARFEPSQEIEYAAHQYTAITVYFTVKFHRAFGG